MTIYRTKLLKWKEAIDNNKIVGVLSTDMSKGFDSLYPSLLIRKLEKYGFTKEPIDMMKSYFGNRRNRLKLADTKSIWKKSERGSLQGSSLCPLLWNIYQNDLSCTVTNCSLSMYADDHQLYVAKDFFYIHNLKIYNSTNHFYINDTIGSMIGMATLNDL